MMKLNCFLCAVALLCISFCTPVFSQNSYEFAQQEFEKNSKKIASMKVQLAKTTSVEKKAGLEKELGELEVSQEAYASLIAFNQEQILKASQEECKNLVENVTKDFDWICKYLLKQEFFDDVQKFELEKISLFIKREIARSEDLVAKTKASEVLDCLKIEQNRLKSFSGLFIGFVIAVAKLDIATLDYPLSTFDRQAIIFAVFIELNARMRNFLKKDLKHIYFQFSNHQLAQAVHNQLPHNLKSTFFTRFFYHVSSSSQQAIDAWISMQSGTADCSSKNLLVTIASYNNWLSEYVCYLELMHDAQECLDLHDVKRQELFLEKITARINKIDQAHDENLGVKYLENMIFKKLFALKLTFEKMMLLDAKDRKKMEIHVRFQAIINDQGFKELCEDNTFSLHTQQFKYVIGKFFASKTYSSALGYHVLETLVQLNRAKNKLETGALKQYFLGSKPGLALISEMNDLLEAVSMYICTSGDDSSAGTILQQIITSLSSDKFKKVAYVAPLVTNVLFEHFGPYISKNLIAKITEFIESKQSKASLSATD
jgi:hypothetical protein